MDKQGDELGSLNECNRHRVPRGREIPREEEGLRIVIDRRRSYTLRMLDDDVRVGVVLCWVTSFPWRDPNGEGSRTAAILGKTCLDPCIFHMCRCHVMRII